jgi:hypothetical protein
MEEDDMCDCELSDLKECNGSGNCSWDFDAYGSQAIVAENERLVFFKIFSFFKNFFEFFA